MAEAPACPECGSRKVWKDGLRRLADGSKIQRYICRTCGYRFSESAQNSKTKRPIASYCRVGAGSKSAKNSAKALVALSKEIEKEAVGLRGPTETGQQVKGRIINFLWQLKKEGYSENTIENYRKFLRLLTKRGANLMDPESVKEVIAKQKRWSSSTKCLASVAYQAFANRNGISWEPPRYKPTRKMPFIPLESEIDALIAGCGKKISTLLQLLKETGMRLGEALSLEWKNIDFKRKIIILNSPEKGGNARVLKMSGQLISMLKKLPIKGSKVFGRMSKHSAEANFNVQRKKVSQKTWKPTAAKNNVSHVETLERNNGIRKDKRHFTRYETARPQKHKQHTNLHSTGKV